MKKTILSGNEAVARGAYEAGCTYAVGYPGTPSTEIIEAISTEYLNDIYCHWATNEKVATEMAFGASIGGARAITTMKAQGMNVATDPIFVMAYQGVTGGVVILCADDPGCHSSQNEQDDRYYAKHAKILMLEPSDSQECKDFTKEAFEISERFDIPILVRTTTRVSHSKSIVELYDRDSFKLEKYERIFGKFSNMPNHVNANHRKLEENLSLAKKFSNNCKYNIVENNAGSRIGIIANGISYQYSREVFGDTASYLKIGLSYPLPDKLIVDFAKDYETIYVVEENDPYLEEYVKSLGVNCIGKDRIPTCGELNPSIIREALTGELHESYTASFDAPNRPPVFCAGCPHKGFYFALGKHRDQYVCYADVGCYAMGYNPPLNGYDAISVMGASFSAGNGLSRALQQQGDKRKVIAAIGDSTFFHSGITGLVDIVKTNANVVVAVLDNRTTAMTGHQLHPGNDSNLMGDDIKAVDIVRVAIGVGIKEENIRVIDPINQEDMHKTLDEAYEVDDAFLIVAKHPCALIKSVVKENANKYCEVDPDKCVGCKSCIKLVCPSISFINNKAVITDKNACTACGLCVQQCKFNAISKVGE
ncbi:indolepyruvate ferredoxin oxidoreductase [Oxobacter pfennigii]|uniref:Indolepyruvate oxidoreductase subunit IorA n=1 Tax=Oxobacter pfennigii TaxID=36849 RepID=A0A0P8WAZ0_9CLOT|nr:thiamine pyrophosphate-dependent enzyme [Oxobacter pfennigii]KPU44891.1 indolepyruvate ferredoxin oxidoreductase [Oxobacter pfennigii]